MKKKTLLLLIIFASIFCIPVVFAKDEAPTEKKCYYRYYSPQFGYTYAVVYIKGKDKPTGYITSFNSQKVKGSGSGNLESVNGWDYDQYVNKKSVCPYYAEVEMSGLVINAASITVGYDKFSLEVKSSGRADKAETHVAVSATIEEDKKTAGDTYDPDQDSFMGDDTGKITNADDKIVTKTKACNYVTTATDRSDYGYSSADLIIGKDKDGNNAALITINMITGNDDVALDNNNFFSWKDEIDDPQGALNDAYTNNRCPYYIYFNNKGKNKPTVLDDRGSYKTSEISSAKIEIVLVSVNITDKSDYDESLDKPATVDSEEDIAVKIMRGFGHGSHKGNGGDDPFQPYTGNIGDDFCSQAEVMRGSKSLGIFVLITRVFVPFLLIIWGTMDVVKIVTTGTEEAIKKQFTKFGIRVLIGLFVFFAPTLIDVAFNSFVLYNVGKDYAICEKCIFHPLDSSKCKAETVKVETSVKDAIEPTAKATVEKLQPGVIIQDPNKISDIH